MIFLLQKSHGKPQIRILCGAEAHIDAGLSVTDERQEIVFRVMKALS